MFSVDVLPVNRMKYDPRSIWFLPDAIDRYGLENAMVSSLKFRTFSELNAAVVTEELFKGCQLRHRVFEATIDRPSSYDFGTIYETRIPLTVTVTTGLSDRDVVVFTQAAPAAISVARQSTLTTLAKIRETVSFARPPALNWGGPVYRK